MSDSSLDAFRHNAWATIELINFCKRLSDEELNASISTGTFGSIKDTLRHLVNSQGNYWFLVSGEWIFHKWGWFEGENPSLDVLEERTKDSEAFWEEFLARGVDSDDTIHHRGPERTEYETKLGVVLAQALNHGNHHRAEITVMLAQLGNEAPDLSGYSYGEATGRRGPRERRVP